jgi:glucose/mannose transport system substrate-binding protein
MFKVEEARRGAQLKMASAVLSPSFQIAFNTVKGSVPARTDVSDAEFTASGKKGMKDLREAADNGTLFGSMAHGHAARPAVMEAVYDVVTSFITGGAYDAATAVEKLADSVANAK